MHKLILVLRMGYVVEFDSSFLYPYVLWKCLEIERGEFKYVVCIRAAFLTIFFEVYHEKLTSEFVTDLLVVKKYETE
jgi:hypothetical protein